MSKAQEFTEKINKLQMSREDICIDSELLEKELESTYGPIVASGFENVVKSIKSIAKEAREIASERDERK